MVSGKCEATRRSSPPERVRIVNVSERFRGADSTFASVLRQR